MTWTTLAAGFCLFALAAHLASIAVALIRCRPRPNQPAMPGSPAVSIIRPLCGIDNFGEETLRSSFELDYPRYELIFCLAHADDPVAGIVRRLIAVNPQIPARLLIGDERIGGNPKLNNVVKGWREAAHSWIVIADSNVLMPRDYIQRLLGAWRCDTGLVCSPPAACNPDGFWAEIESAFLNSYQARWQYFADTFGYGFAQGKTMLWRRADLERAGGIRALATEVAEDAAATKVVRQAGLRVRLVDAPFGQPLGRRKAIDVWNRQLRWARLRRASFLHCFLPEFLGGGFFPLLAASILAPGIGYPAAALAFIAAWYGAETLLVFAAGWPLSVRTPLLAILRDLMLPLLWAAAWRSRRFVWRGNAMHAAASARSL
jgi:ceramide glucosyltransferase